jgi:hypothetical protein
LLQVVEAQDASLHAVLLHGDVVVLDAHLHV